MKNVKIVLVTLLSIASLSALAMEAGKEAGVTGIKKSDANKDGMVSLDEYLANEKINATKMFQHIDANSDGKLDAAEQKDVDAVMKSMYGAPAMPAEKAKSGISM